MQLSITQLLIRWRYRRADILIRSYIYNVVSTRQCPSSRSSDLVAPLDRNKLSLWRVLPFTVAAQHQNSSNCFIYFIPLVSLQTEMGFFSPVSLCFVFWLMDGWIQHDSAEQTAKFCHFWKGAAFRAQKSTCVTMLSTPKSKQAWSFLTVSIIWFSVVWCCVPCWILT